MRRPTICVLAAVVGLATPAAMTNAQQAPAAAGPATPAQLEQQLAEHDANLGVADWLTITQPGHDTFQLADYVERRRGELIADGIAELLRADRSAWADDDTRKLTLLRQRTKWPLPADPDARASLARLVAGYRRNIAMTALCVEAGPCLDRIAVEEHMSLSTGPDERQFYREGWLDQLAPQRSTFSQTVMPLNAAAAQWGYEDFVEWLAAGYATDGAGLTRRVDALWLELKPLYGALHCHVAAHLDANEIASSQTADGTIPARLLGTLDPRDWRELRDVAAKDLPAPFSLEQAVPDRFSSIQELAHFAAAFFGTLGYPALPDSFWQRSQFDSSSDEAGCLRAGRDVDSYRDVRIAICNDIGAENFDWLHRTIATLHYNLAFADLDWAYRTPPHPGFDYAHAQVALLSLTPIYLRGLGLLQELPGGRSEIARLLDQALRTLPRLMGNIAAADWQRSVFSGSTAPAAYDRDWWQSMRHYAGIDAASRRDDGFAAALLPEIAAGEDPIAEVFGVVLGYQLLGAACAGASVPLHQCSIAGDKVFGSRLHAMLSLGASKPWPDALELATGSRQVSASALLEYYAPLRRWLDEQNSARTCAW